jgi:hypothetical protein
MLGLLMRAKTPPHLIYAGRSHVSGDPSRGEGRHRPDPRDGIARAGSIVLVCPEGIPEMLRVRSSTPEVCRLFADADSAAPFDVPRASILGTARLPRRSGAVRGRTLRRVRLDLGEALTGRPDPAPDPADTVRSKYDAQAPFYARLESAGLPESLLSWCRERIPKSGRILVAGSGTGRESFALVREGWERFGHRFLDEDGGDGAPGGRTSGTSVGFVASDLRAHEEAPGSLAAVFFTYDVYSFLPAGRERVAMLSRMARWLEPGGVVFLSARRCGRAYEAFVLTLQRLARAGGARPEAPCPGARATHAGSAATESSTARSSRSSPRRVCAAKSKPRDSGWKAGEAITACSRAAPTRTDTNRALTGRAHRHPHPRRAGAALAPPPIVR